eukprot:12928890-Prorocentrum_lima.AAC.1
MQQSEGQVFARDLPMYHLWHNLTTFFDPDKEEHLMDVVKEYTHKRGEAEPSIKGRHQLEEDQLLK